ncbi:uncharacterized protein B0T15DRAFT_535803 [Chaetomium strumarium]|uniref:EKC/KEOPS complex subunit GON7 n=1 Tax=Chaetomium strumarium TaxID=1170767 RepID=A0AAJ0GQT8_9PEZI|nr:hypothetical protein B0T15DRAFT_535803 [Chaetomium strumarium]
MTSSQSQPTLSANYTSTGNASFTIHHPLTAPPSSTTVENKIASLAELRRSIIVLQNQINQELTARMEEDQARNSSATKANGVKKIIDDEKEEENYGEEVQDEEQQ